ncbi:MAG: M20/M25/M40 family metallo-hydrolase [Holophagaceae bacterium]
MRTTRALAAGPLLLLALAAPAQDRARLKEDVFTLASPGYQGRATGQLGQRLAADLVARRFREAGLQPLRPGGFGGPTPFHWPYTLERVRIDEGGSRLALDGSPVKLGSEAFTSRALPGSGEAVLVGYGVRAPEAGWDDYAGAEVRGRWVVAFDGEAPRPSGCEAQAWSQACAAEAKAAAAARAGALGLVLLQDQRPGARDLARLGAWISRAARGGRVALKGAAAVPPPSILVPAAGLKAFPGAAGLQERVAAAGRPLPPRVLGRLDYAPKVRSEDLPASNVVGLLPGADPALKEEYVILSAHHDHVGLEGGALHPGADDNASGTSVLMEVARLLRGARPRRSILFVSVSGEEIGLFGSQAFVDAPPVELGKVKADLNIDMVGRNDPAELSVTPARVDGAVSSLTQQARVIAGARGLRLTDEADTYWTRSDHYTFFRKGIPAIFFFGGMHKDYHQATDTPDKINLEKLVRVAAFVRDLALATADAPEAPRMLAKETWSGWAWPSAPPPGPLAATH